MTKKRQITSSLFSDSGSISKRLAYSCLAIAIAIAHILYGVSNVRATTPPAALVQQGKIAYDRGNFPTALKMWEQAEAGYVRSSDPVGVAGSQINRSQALMAMGLDRRACKLLTGTVGVSASVCEADIPTKFGIRQTHLPPALQALAIAKLGDVLRGLGNLEAAQVTLARASEIAKPLSAADRSPILVSIANTLRDLGNRDRDRTDRLQPPASTALTCPTQPTGSLQAAAYYQYAIACYQQAGTLTADIDQLSLQVDISKWQLNRGTGESIARSWQERLNQSALIRHIETQLPSQPDTYEGLSQRINVARSLVLADRPRWEAAKSLLNDVMRRSRERQTSILTDATGTLGWLYEQQQQWSKAVEFTQQAISLATTPKHDRQYQWEWQLGRILQHQSQPDFIKSQAAYDRAVAAIEKTRQNLRIVNPDAQFSLRDNVEPLYREAIDLSLRSSQPDLPQIIDRVNALKLVELENFLQCQLGADKPVDAPGESLRQRFAEDASAVVFYPVMLAERLEVILRLPGNKFQRFVVPVSRVQLETKIDRFGQNLNQPQYGWNDAAAAQLYDWLIRPAQTYLTPTTKQLVFVMDGALQNIPVAALYDRSGVRPIGILSIIGAKFRCKVRGSP